MAKIQDVQVDWANGWSNSPRFQVLVDTLKEQDLFQQRGAMHLAITGELAHFYAYTRPGEGYGGRSFTITMTDGTEKELKGPWSGNSEEVNKVFPTTPVLEANVTDERDVMARGHTFYSGAVTLDGLLRYWQEHVHKIDWGIALVERYFGTWIEPTRGSCIKVSANESAKVLAILAPHDAERDNLEDWVKFFRTTVIKTWMQKSQRKDID